MLCAAITAIDAERGVVVGAQHVRSRVSRGRADRLPVPTHVRLTIATRSPILCRCRKDAPRWPFRPPARCIRGTSLQSADALDGIECIRWTALARDRVGGARCTPSIVEPQLGFNAGEGIYGGLDRSHHPRAAPLRVRRTVVSRVCVVTSACAHSHA